MSQATSLLMQLLSSCNYLAQRSHRHLCDSFFPAEERSVKNTGFGSENLERQHVFELVYVGSVPSITDGVISMAVLAPKDCRDPSLRHRYVGAFTVEWHRLVEIRQN